MKASRLMAILMLLQSQGRATAPALAGRLEVSVRTILRDMDELSAAGVPVYADRGRAGGWRLMEGWKTDLTGFTETEARAVALAGVPSAALQLGLGGTTAVAWGKLVAALGPSARVGAGQVAERLHVDPVDWYRAAETPRCLPELADAVWRARRVTGYYQSWTRRERKTLEPLGLVLKAGAWYLVARRAGQTEVRTYRAANFDELRVLADGFKRPRRFDLAAHWRAATASFETGRHPLRARVRLSERARGWLRNARTPFEPVLPTEVSADAVPDGCEGWMAVESIDHGVRALLALGDEAEVLGPPALRRAMRAQVAALARVYVAGAPGKG
ncbi:helix-turn-helix transcriptional regulator [Ottowia sp.]|uniref:helix-turn-helix transcriptional regulator n=1 Tax=Ottowia sp. TaxID=1898956 RepID=UPI0039E25D81